MLNIEGTVRIRLEELFGDCDLPKWYVESSDTYLKSAIQQYKKNIGLSALEICARQSNRAFHQKASTTKATSLDDTSQKLATFDRDLWPGLLQLGLTWKEAEAVAHSYYGAKIYNRSVQPMGEHTDLHFTELDDLKLCCVSEDQAESKRIFLQKPEESSYTECLKKGNSLRHKPVLLLVKKGKIENCSVGNNLKYIEYTGLRKHFDFFLSLLENPRWQHLFKMQLACGSQLVHFRAFLSEKNNSSLDEFIDEILSVVLISGRPVRHYTATFFLPLEIRQNQIIEEKGKLEKVEMLQWNAIKLESTKKTDNEYQSFAFDDVTVKSQIQAYFSPLLQKQLFYTGEGNHEIEPIIQYQLKQLPFKSVHLKGHEQNPEAQIEDVSLFCHPLGQSLLAIQLGMSADNIKTHSWYREDTADTYTWWHDLVYVSHQKTENQAVENKPVNEIIQSTKHNQVENWLRLSHGFRFLYQSYIQQQDEQKIHEIVYGHENVTNLKHGELNSLVVDLLMRTGAMSKERTQEYLKASLREDRMFINVAYAVAGQAPQNEFAKKETYRLFTIAMNVDRQEDAALGRAVYSDNYIQNHLDTKIYKRWCDEGSYYGFMDHAHVSMGYGRYSFETISKLHVPYIYGRMSILNLLYREQLRNYERRLCTCHSNRNETGKLYSEIATFTSKYWFHEVTEQQQGKEIFDLQKVSMGLEQYYEIIDKEIKSTEQDHNNKFQSTIATLGLLIALIAFLATFIPVGKTLEQVFTPIATKIESSSVSKQSAISPFAGSSSSNNSEKTNEQQKQDVTNKRTQIIYLWLVQVIFVSMILIFLKLLSSKLGLTKQSTINFSIELLAYVGIQTGILCVFLLYWPDLKLLILVTTFISAVLLLGAKNIFGLGNKK